jgi:hypothetical protein
LIERGLRRVLIVVHDDFSGLLPITKSLFPGADVQLCAVHMQRNARNHLSKTDNTEFQQPWRAVRSTWDEQVGITQFEELCQRFDPSYPTFVAELRRTSGSSSPDLNLMWPGDNWSKQAVALEHIEKAVAEGLDVGFDCYPYIAGSTVLTQLLPQWSLEGGIERLLARLNNRAERKRIAAQTDASLEQGWANILISAVETSDNRHLIGQSIAAVAASRSREPIEVVFDLLQEEQGRVNMLEMNQSETNLRQTLTHPLSSVISDGFYVKGRPHPRLYGTFPLLLGEMSRERRCTRRRRARTGTSG